MTTKHSRPSLHTTSGSVTDASDDYLFAVLLSAGGSNSSVSVYNNTTGAGAPAIKVNALANDTKFVDFSYLGGVPFSNGMYVSVTSGSAFLWRE